MDSNKQGFPQVFRKWGRGIFKISFFWGGQGGGDLSQYVGEESMGGFQERGNILLISVL